MFATNNHDLDTVASDGMPHRAGQGWQLQDVVLQRGTMQVFDGLTLDLPDARIGLIGSNGAGKTSLLRLLCALEVPQHGSIRLNGQLRHGPQHSQQPGREVGLMFQNPDDQIIFPTVQEELALSWQSTHAGNPALLRREVVHKGVSSFLRERGLEHWAQRPVATLSQGQRQWVCWLALRLGNPDVLLLDEPYASLDLAGQMRLAQDMAQCPQQIIVSTHVLEHVRSYARVLWMEGGRIRADGPGDEVCAAYERWVRTQYAARTTPPPMESPTAAGNASARALFPTEAGHGQSV